MTYYLDYTQRRREREAQEFITLKLLWNTFKVGYFCYKIYTNDPFNYYDMLWVW